MNRHRFISPLTQEQYSDLDKIMKESQSRRTRNRAHAIILSNKGYTIEQLTDFFDVNRDTITRWLNHFEKYDAVGLWDNLRPGRTPILNESEIDLALEFLDKKPNESKSALQDIIKKTGKNLSHRTLKRIAKRHGLVWKRIKKVPKKPYNESEFRQAQEDLKAFETQAKKGKCEVVYFDAAGCDLTPCISHAWQPIGTENTIKVPSSRSKRLNILGFLDSTGDELTSLVFEGGTISSAEVIASIDEFCARKLKSESSNSTENPKPMSKESQNPSQKDPQACAKPEVKVPFQSQKKRATTSIELIESASLETDAITNPNQKSPKPIDSQNPSQKDPQACEKPEVKVPSQSQKKRATTSVELIESTSLEKDAVTNPNKKSPLAEFDNNVFKKPIIVPIDNAPIHTSDEFINCIERWQAMGLFLYFLPSYSPQLNKIEILWKKIKYEWLPLDAYQNFTKLKKAIDEILSQYGSNYHINFA